MSVLTGDDNTRTIQTINTSEGVCSNMASRMDQSCDNNGDDDSSSIELLVMEQSQQSGAHSRDNSKSSRQGPNTVLIDIINNLQVSKKVQKKPSELTSSKAVQNRVDEGLAYLIRLCGFNNLKTVSKIIL